MTEHESHHGVDQVLAWWRVSPVLRQRLPAIAVAITITIAASSNPSRCLLSEKPVIPAVKCSPDLCNPLHGEKVERCTQDRLFALPSYNDSSGHGDLNCQRQEALTINAFEEVGVP